ncbi:MAG: NAD(P)H-dependent oxidoreductase subunit E, partial [Cyclobacteriaceae bacterium]
MASRKGLDNPLFEKLVEISKEKRVPDPKEMRSLAREFLVGNANVHGTVSFYDFLKAENQSKKIFVCNGSACLVAGTQKNLKKKLEEHFKEEEIGHMCCLGRCHENSAYHYNGKNYSGNEALEIDAVLGNQGINNDTYHVSSNLKEPILTSPYPDQTLFFDFIRECLTKDKDQLLAEIKKSNVRGRGGAGFPIGFKLESCKNNVADQKFVVCNADEGDPGAYSDRYLLEKQPHLLLFGMMMAGYIIGSNRGVIYIRGEYPESIVEVNKEIEKWEQNGLLGENINNSGFDFRFKIIEGAGAYICGEETAL